LNLGGWARRKELSVLLPEYLPNRIDGLPDTLVGDQVRPAQSAGHRLSRSIQRRLPLFEAALAYAAAEVGLTNNRKGLSKEVIPKGIRVTTVSPRYSKTEVVQGMAHEIAQQM
jgi:NAD(P)-dependent dehydrogenase (short-subunit alcohol dehydrogenase family)